MKVQPTSVRRVEEVRNCWTCGWDRVLVRSGSLTCDALTGDEDEDWPIIEYTNAHCDLKGDGMPMDTAACPVWVPR